jgi:pilus assembly protein CpaC
MVQGKGAVGKFAGAILGILLLTVTTGARDARAQAKVMFDLGVARYAGEFVVPINKSQILRVDTPFADLLVGNPEIADVLPLTNRTVYVLGRGLGSTSLSVYGRNKVLIAILDLVVTPDVEGLKRRLFDLMPSDPVGVRAVNDSVVLSGTVSSAGQVTQAAAVAERYAPGNVINLLKINESQQVMLDVRFAEMTRNVVKELGINTDLLVDTGDATITLLTGRLLSGGTAADLFGTVAGSGVFAGGDVVLDAVLDALEQRGLVKTLAEPKLIAMSGDTASFLAGGEFPIPVAQEGGADGGTAITVEFKEFGVSLSFTPTVISGDLINLVVAPEVSSIDRSTAIVSAGISVPGLTTRRAKTTVELRDGQSFAIAGLLQSDFQDNIRQLPFLGDIPILGALFRSSEYQRGETELVITVTPYLVKPGRPSDMVLPTDNFIPPSDLGIFLFGQTEAPDSGKPAAPSNSTLDLQEAGGLDGRFGHIIQ